MKSRRPWTCWAEGTCTIGDSGRGAAWLARLLGVQEVPSSNLGGPTKTLHRLLVYANNGANPDPYLSKSRPKSPFNHGASSGLTCPRGSSSIYPDKKLCLFRNLAKGSCRSASFPRVDGGTAGVIWVTAAPRQGIETYFKSETATCPGATRPDGSIRREVIRGPGRVSGG
jgi:hypothetical protein